MKIAYLAATLLALTALQPVGAFAASKPAAKGVKCGDSYIAAGKTCTKAPAAPGKGVKCGDSYIAAGKTCTKTTTPAAPGKPAMPMKTILPMKATAPAAKPMAAPAKPATTAMKTAAKPAGKKCGNGYIAANAKCTKK